MTVSGLFQYPEGRGWIVLSGGADSGSVIRAQVLRRARAEGGTAYLVMHDDDADATLDDMDDLGAPTGYQVNLSTEDDTTIRNLIREASIIVIDSTATPRELLGGLRGTAEESLREALADGAMLLFEGTSAALLGTHWFDADGTARDGLSWLQNSVIVTQRDTVNAARQFVEATPSAFLVDIALGSALALGEAGEVEIWGERRVTIALGREYRRMNHSQHNITQGGE